MNDAPHPFARFVATLGRGKTLTRSLTIAEAEEAMAMILAGDARPEQVGAFLMLLRMKEEAPEEIAGFIRAARATFHLPAGAPRVDLDWPSYAGKKRQLPWHLLAAILLARDGRRVFMHGLDGHTKGRLYSGEALEALGFRVARGFDEAAAQLVGGNFAYMQLHAFAPRMAELMLLKPVLGLRSAVNTLVRGLNPFGAAASMQSVFHPAYVATHRDASLLLGEPRVTVFRGDGGENERRPNKPCETVSVVAGAVSETRWPPTIDPRQSPDEDMDVRRLAAVWRGAAVDPFGEATVIATVAVALHAMGAEPDVPQAEARARALWADRDRAHLAEVA
ncbi:MAG: glycosyl transferase family protein [Hyphomicrobiales bacterium]|nr:glycosyl transferase family protein [Hyphomicrobiales bacterium]MDE2018037.1 glycosyl transferase family protein [Hyphomicrobiales bacterium]